MLEKLQAIARRLDQVERQLSDPAVYADRESLTRLSREQKELTPIVAAFRAWQQAEADCAGAQELLSDPEMRELAQEELHRARQERDRLSEELKRLLLPRDPNDDRNVILEVRAGIGGEVGALFAADLLRMYALYAERRGWNMELVYEVCLNYAQKFGRFYFKNLFLSGAPGLGKTFLSACIARTVSEEGFSVVYDTAGNIFAQFELKKFQRDAQDAQEAKDETRRYLNCDLLILDDLGSELTTQFTQSALYELVNTRLVAGRCTVISSNLSMDEAARRYSPQIASRLAGEYHVLHFFGDDIRLLKKQRM